jgi:N-acetylneuraminic acid mutarotase
MLTESIKNKITVQYGHQIRYSKDCENLAFHITEKVGANISASTVKRLFGFVKTTSKPNNYTLDIIARYLDAKNWDDLVKSSDTSITLNKKTITNRLKKLFFIFLLGCFICIVLFSILLNNKKLNLIQKWQTHKELPEVRKGGTALKYGTTLFYLGGSDAEFIRSTNWCFSISKKTWKRLKDLPNASAEMGCVVIKNKIYCFGGWRGEKLGASDKAQVYSIEKNTWDTLPQLPQAMVAVKAIVFQNKIYIIGGTLGETKNYFFKYDINKREYQELPKFKINRIHFHLQKTDSSIYIFGGNSFKNGEYQIHNTVDTYSFFTNKWLTKKSIPKKIMCCNGFMYGSSIHLFGGKNLIGDKKEGISSTHYSYNVQQNKWKIEMSLPIKICDFELVHFKNQLLIIGGSMDFPNPSKKIYSLELK